MGGGFKAPKSMGVKSGSKAMGISEKGDRKRTINKSPKSRKVDKDEEMELESPEDIFGASTPDGQENSGGFFSAIGDIGSSGPAVSIFYFSQLQHSEPSVRHFMTASRHLHST